MKRQPSAEDMSGVELDVVQMVEQSAARVLDSV
jgi:hypothetical protein